MPVDPIAADIQGILTTTYARTGTITTQQLIAAAKAYEALTKHHKAGTFTHSTDETTAQTPTPPTKVGVTHRPETTDPQPKTS